MTAAGPRIAILGSCVTRQAFRHRLGPESWRLARPVLYQARTSFVSLTSPPLEPPEDLLAAIDDPFEQRSTRDDFQRSFWRRLEASQPDLLLIDLVDERFDLVAGGPAPDGRPRYATLNERLARWDREQARAAAGALLRGLRQRLAKVTEGGVTRFGLRRMRRMSEEVHQLWQQGAAGFAQRLRAEHPRLRVALHLAPLPSTFEDGSQGDDPQAWWLQRPAQLSALRGLLGSYGERLRRLFPEAPVLRPPAEVHLLGRHHPWGEQPWHYGRAYYRDLVRQIRAIS